MHTRSFYRRSAHCVGVFLYLCTIAVNDATGQAITLPASQTPWTTTRGKAGDTIVVRNSGTTSKAADLKLVEETRITGQNIPGGSGFTSITRVTPTANYGVLFYDSGLRRVVHVDSAGQFVRFIGANGSGPGEYTGVRGVHVTPEGRVYVSMSFGDGHIYSPSGSYERSWPRLTAIATATLMSVTTDGHVSLRTRVGPPQNPDSVNGFGAPVVIDAAIRFRPDLLKRDTIFPPEAPRVQAMLNFISFSGPRPADTNYENSARTILHHVVRHSGLLDRRRS